MRKPTPRELESWRVLAERHGAVDAQGKIIASHTTLTIGPGRVESDGTISGIVTLTVVTPVTSSDEYTVELQRKTPPILLDRNPQGEIVQPGAAWASFLEVGAEDPQRSAEERWIATHMSRYVEFADTLLPHDIDTVEFVRPNSDGTEVIFEALRPGTKITFRIEVPDLSEIKVKCMDVQYVDPQEVE